jgi:hypothetical protein
MELLWDEIPDLAREEVERGLKRNVGRFNHISLTDLLNAFELLRYNWTENPEMRKVIFKSFCRAFSTDPAKDVHARGGLSAGVFYFGKIGLRWNELPEEVQETILRELLSYSDSLTAFQLKCLLEGYDGS